MTDEPAVVLSEDESWRRLGGAALGRLVSSFAGEPEIFPVNYAVQHRTVLFRTAEGTKLFSAVTNSVVLFEADDHDVAEGWSVIVRGRARVLRTAAEFDVNLQLRRLLEGPDLPLSDIETVLRESRDESVALDETTVMTIERAVERMAQQFSEEPEDLDGHPPRKKRRPGRWSPPI